MSTEPHPENRLEGNVGEDFARKYLVQIAVDDVNWKILYKNPTTNEYWKEFFPSSELQGGGPPIFIKVSKNDAEHEFNTKL